MSAARPSPDEQAPTHPNVLNRLDVLETVTTEIRNDLRDIKFALVGNDELKTRGIMQRVEAVEASDAEQNKRLLAWGTVVTGIGAGITQVIEFFKK